MGSRLQVFQRLGLNALEECLRERVFTKTECSLGLTSVRVHLRGDRTQQMSCSRVKEADGMQACERGLCYRTNRPAGEEVEMLRCIGKIECKADLPSDSK